MATHSSILVWRIPWTEEPGGLQSTRLQRAGHNWETSLHFIHKLKIAKSSHKLRGVIISIFLKKHPQLKYLVFTLTSNYIYFQTFFLSSHNCKSWRRKWQPTPVLLPGKFHGQRSLVGYSPWGCKESDTTEQLHFTSFLRIEANERGRILLLRLRSSLKPVNKVFSSIITAWNLGVCIIFHRL